MLQFILKRLLLAIPTLFVVTFLVFAAARLTRSDPAEITLGEKSTAQQRALFRQKHGLDKPLILQYVNYIGGVVRGDFGESYKLKTPAVRLIAAKFPVTVTLAVSALLFSMCVGLPLGALAAYYHNSWFDRALMACVVALVSIPSMVLGPLLLILFAVKLKWLPTSGWTSWSHLILPTIALGSRSAALVARFMRSSLLETLRQDYIRTARAKGLSRFAAVWRHGIKNAFLPVLTVLGTTFGILLTGSFVIETIFQVPGIGDISIESITYRDYPVLQGMAMLVAVTYVMVNLVVDILYGVFDPRVQVKAE